jgi:hypothetical protein
MIHCHGVMDSSVGQPVAPDAIPTIKICSGVAGDVPAAYPQVHVELVGVGGTGTEVGAADDGLTVRAAQEVEAAVGVGGFYNGVCELQPWSRFSASLCLLTAH